MGREDVGVHAFPRGSGVDPAIHLSIGFAVLLLLGAAIVDVSTAGAITLFDESFDSSTDFASGGQKFGIPLPPDADEAGWNAARFDHDFADPRRDVGIQAYGGGGNVTQVGLVEDDAGLYFEISTLGLSDVVLEFDWRTFSAFGGDRLRAGYLEIDSPTLDPTTGAADFRFGAYAWPAWTELLEGKGHTFQHVSYGLPSNTTNLLIAFWLDNGENDFGKFDNVRVTAVPEPRTALMVGLGLALFSAGRRLR